MVRYIKDDVAKFLGLEPFGSMNPCFGDGYFAADCGAYWGVEKFNAACDAARGKPNKLREAVDSKAAAKKKLLKAIHRYKRSAISMSWICSMHLDDQPYIRQEFNLSRKNLDKIIDEVIYG